MVKKKIKPKMKKTKTRKQPPELRFEVTSGMALPEVINWQEKKVMAKLAKYFKGKIKAGVRHISMAQILKLFGHLPQPYHYKQIFEIADVSNEPRDYDAYYGISHKGIFYPMISDSVH